MILFCREVCIFSQSRWNLQKNKNSTREKFKAKSTEKTFIDLVSDDDSSMEEGTFANDTKTNNLGKPLILRRVKFLTENLSSPDLLRVQNTLIIMLIPLMKF